MGCLRNLSLFVGGEGCFELGCDRLRELTLEREDVLQFAIISFRPNLTVGLGIDELGVNSHAIARNLHASLQHVRNVQVATDLLQISILAAVRCDTTAADDLQISHLAEISQNIVLNTIGEIRRRAVVTQIFEGQDCNAFPTVRAWCVSSPRLHARRLTSILLGPTPKTRTELPPAQSRQPRSPRDVIHFA